MSGEPFGRQPQPVKVTLVGEGRDVDHYARKIKSFIENSSYDVVTFEHANIFTIHPAAVNN